MPNLLIAIVVHGSPAAPQFARYQYNIKNTEQYKSKFLKDMQRKFSHLHHVNFYDKQTGSFIEQRKG